MKKKSPTDKIEDSPKDKFRLIKNENYQPPRKPRPRLRIMIPDLPPAA